MGVRLGSTCKGKNTDWNFRNGCSEGRIFLHNFGKHKNTDCNFRNGCSEGRIFLHNSGKHVTQYAVVTNPTDKIHTFQCFNLQNLHTFLAPLAHHQGARVYQSVARPYCHSHTSVYWRWHNGLAIDWYSCTTWWSVSGARNMCGFCKLKHWSDALCWSNL